MIGETKDKPAVEELDDDVDEEELDDGESPVAISEDDEPDDNVGDISVEINVEELVAKLEATDGNDVERKREIRKRLDALEEDRQEDLDSTYNFNLDDDL